MTMMGQAGGFLAKEWCRGQDSESLSQAGFKMHAEIECVYLPAPAPA